MNTQLKNSTEPFTPWYKERWMILVLGVPLASLCLGIVIVSLAVSGKDSLISDSYYKDGMAYTENREFIHKAQRLQIKAEFTYNDGEIRTSISGYLDDNPTFLTLQLIHPTLENKDESVILQQTQEGIYLGLADRDHLGKRKLWLMSPEQEWMIKDEALIQNNKAISLTQ